jgi:hypothetical protein
VAASGATAVLLHGAGTRAEAAWVVPIAWAWSACALVAVRDRPSPPAWLAVAVAAAVRAPLIGAPPLLSDDVYRYVWEGRAILAGQSPWLHAPTALPGLDTDGLLAHVNHADIPSIYPPLAMAWFALLAALGSVPRAQGATAAADLVIVASIAAYCRTEGRGAWTALLYALHPLPALESAVGAHLETVALAVATTALAAGPGSGGALWSAAAGVKLFPALLLPSLPRRSWVAAAAGLIVTAGMSAMILGSTAAAHAWLATLRLYADSWSFDGFAFTPATALLGAHSRPILGLIGAAVVAYVLVIRRPLVDAWRIVGTAFLLLTPTAHPWYALWAFVPGLLAGRPAWAVVGGALLGSYAVLARFDAAAGTWTEPAWLWPLVWVPALAALAWDSVSATEATPTIENPVANRTTNGTDA